MAVRLPGDSPLMKGELGHVLGSAGTKDKAMSILAEPQTLRKSGYSSCYRKLRFAPALETVKALWPAWTKPLRREIPSGANSKSSLISINLSALNRGSGNSRNAWPAETLRFGTFSQLTFVFTLRSLLQWQPSRGGCGRCVTPGF
jgi:hypothetical protein